VSSLGLGDDTLVFVSVAAAVVIATVFGGSSRPGLWSNGFVQLACLLTLGVLAFRGRFSELPRLAIVILAALFILPLLQLLPLPPSLWTQLPGREQFATGYEQMGLGLPWLPLSLNPQATWLSILGLLPGVVVFLGTVSLGLRGRRTIGVIFIALGVVGVLLGLAQLMEGPDSALRIYYPRTNYDSSVGFFANRNHQGAFLYSLVPLVAAWAAGFLFEKRPERTFGLVACVLVYIAFILGFAMAGSRAALFLGVGATVASLLLVAGSGGQWSGRNVLILAGATLVAAVLVVQFAFFSILGRLDDDGVVDTRRWQMAETTTTAAQSFQPFGSGLGTFPDVYKIFEQPHELKRSYVNHAHNEWLEIWLEGGIPFALLALLFLGWFGVAAYRVWRAPAKPGTVLDGALAKAATIAMLLLLVHSFVDYPLRTSTLMALFGFCAGLLVGPPRRGEVEAEAEGDAEGAPVRNGWRGGGHRYRAGQI
jgi:O-antigen ligase